MLLMRKAKITLLLFLVLLLCYSGSRLCDQEVEVTELVVPMPGRLVLQAESGLQRFSPQRNRDRYYIIFVWQVGCFKWHIN